MRAQWQVKIPAPHFMAGIHTFHTRARAWAFAREWEKAQRNTGASGAYCVTTLRDGMIYSRVEWEQ